MPKKYVQVVADPIEGHALNALQLSFHQHLGHALSVQTKTPDLVLQRIGPIDAIGTRIEFEGKDILQGWKREFIQSAGISQIDAKDFLPLGNQDKVGLFRNGTREPIGCKSQSGFTFNARIAGHQSITFGPVVKLTWSTSRWNGKGINGRIRIPYTLTRQLVLFESEIAFVVIAAALAVGYRRRPDVTYTQSLLTSVDVSGKSTDQ